MSLEESQSMTDQGLKICSVCNTPKPKDQFERRPDSIDGRRAQCKQCQSERRGSGRRQSNYEQGRTDLNSGVKECFSCQQIKPLASFRKQARNEDGLRRLCKDCQKPQESRYREADRELLRQKSKRYKSHRDAVSQRHSQLRFLYRLDPVEYERLRTLQNGLCAICGKPPTAKKKFLSVDHDHETGLVRGLLCFNCNLALGHFQDDLTLVEKAANYLRRSAQENGNVEL